MAFKESDTSIKVGRAMPYFEPATTATVELEFKPKNSKIMTERVNKFLEISAKKSQQRIPQPITEDEKYRARINAARVAYDQYIQFMDEHYGEIYPHKRREFDERIYKLLHRNGVPYAFVERLKEREQNLAMNYGINFATKPIRYDWVQDFIIQDLFLIEERQKVRVETHRLLERLENGAELTDDTLKRVVALLQKLERHW